MPKKSIEKAFDALLLREAKRWFTSTATDSELGTEICTLFRDPTRPTQQLSLKNFMSKVEMVSRKDGIPHPIGLMLEEQIYALFRRLADRI